MLLNTTNITNVYGIVGILLQFWGLIPDCATYYSTSKLLEDISLHSLVNSAIVEPFQVLYTIINNHIILSCPNSISPLLHIYIYIYITTYLAQCITSETTMATHSIHSKIVLNILKNIIFSYFIFNNFISKVCSYHIKHLNI